MNRQFELRGRRFDRCQPAERLGKTSKADRLRHVAARYRGEYRNLDPDSFAIYDKVRVFLDGGRLYVCRPGRSVVTLRAGGAKVADALVDLTPPKVLARLLQRKGSFVLDFDKLATVVTYPDGTVTRHPWRVV